MNEVKPQQVAMVPLASGNSIVNNSNPKSVSAVVGKNVHVNNASLSRKPVVPLLNTATANTSKLSTTKLPSTTTPTKSPLEPPAVVKRTPTVASTVAVPSSLNSVQTPRGQQPPKVGGGNGIVAPAATISASLPVAQPNVIGNGVVGNGVMTSVNNGKVNNNVVASGTGNVKVVKTLAGDATLAAVGKAAGNETKATAAAKCNGNSSVNDVDANTGSSNIGDAKR